MSMLVGFSVWSKTAVDVGDWEWESRGRIDGLDEIYHVFAV